MVVQAMLAGVPVVATDADGTREVCVPEKTGRLVPIGDVEALRSALQDHLDHPQRSQQWAEEAEASVVPSSLSMPWWMRWRRCMTSCWLEAVVLVWPNLWVGCGGCRPTLTAPTYQRCCVKPLKQVSIAGDPDDWPSRAATRLASTDRGPSQSGGQDPAGDRLLPGHSHAQPHIFCGPEDCGGQSAFWMQLGITNRNLATWLRCVVPCSTSPQDFPKRHPDSPIRSEVDPFCSRSPDFDNGLISQCAKLLPDRHANAGFLESAGFPLGELGQQWRDDIRDVRIALPNTLLKLGTKPRCTTLCIQCWNCWPCGFPAVEVLLQ